MTVPLSSLTRSFNDAIRQMDERAAEQARILDALLQTTQQNAVQQARHEQTAQEQALEQARRFEIFTQGTQQNLAQQRQDMERNAQEQVRQQAQRHETLATQRNIAQQGQQLAVHNEQARHLALMYNTQQGVAQQGQQVALHAQEQARRFDDFIHNTQQAFARQEEINENLNRRLARREQHDNQAEQAMADRVANLEIQLRNMHMDAQQRARQADEHILEQRQQIMAQQQHISALSARNQQQIGQNPARMIDFTMAAESQALGRRGRLPSNHNDLPLRRYQPAEGETPTAQHATVRAGPSTGSGGRLSSGRTVLGGGAAPIAPIGGGPDTQLPPLTPADRVAETAAVPDDDRNLYDLLGSVTSKAEHAIRTFATVRISTRSAEPKVRYLVLRAQDHVEHRGRARENLEDASMCTPLVVGLVNRWLVENIYGHDLFSHRGVHPTIARYLEAWAAEQRASTDLALITDYANRETLVVQRARLAKEVAGMDGLLEWQQELASDLAGRLTDTFSPFITPAARPAARAAFHEPVNEAIKIAVRLR